MSRTLTALRRLVLLALVVATVDARAQTPAGPLAAGLDSLFAAAHAQGQFHGVALVAVGEDPVYHAAFGPADRTWEIPNAPDTRFRIASVSKSFTAYLVLRLVDEGLMDLSAPLSTYLADHPGGDAITLHQLLSNSAGVPHYEGLEAVGLTIDAFRPMAITPEAYAELIGRMPAAHAPGTAFHYSSFGYDLVGAAIEAATGLSYGDALARYVTDPLGLGDTGYEPGGAVVPRLAEGYEPTSGGTTGQTFVHAPHRHASNAYAAGGLYSSAPDLLRWSLALHDGALVPPHLQARMQTNHVQGLADPVSYGYGLAVHTGAGGGFGDIGLDRPYVIHGGAYDGYRSLFVSIDGGAATLVLLSNAGEATDELGLGRAVADLLNRHVSR